MKKEKIIMLCVLVLIILGFGAFKYYSNNSSEGLCIYEIPNHIKIECPAGNSTRIVNYFQITLFEYENAVGMGCIDSERLNTSGYRYEISKCNESITFDVFN